MVLNAKSFSREAPCGCGKSSTGSCEPMPGATFEPGVAVFHLRLESHILGAVVMLWFFKGNQSLFGARTLNGAGKNVDDFPPIIPGTVKARPGAKLSICFANGGDMSRTRQKGLAAQHADVGHNHHAIATQMCFLSS